MDFRPPRMMMIAAGPVFGLMVACQPVAMLTAPAPVAPAAAEAAERVDVVEVAEPVSAMPPAGDVRPIVFTGSSSIRLWDQLPEDYPGLGVINLGFGGSQLSDLIEQFERVILEPKPRQVVIYSGSNDIAANKSAATVVADLKAVVERIHRELPDARVAYISIALNPARWDQREAVMASNAAIEEFMAGDERRQFIDVTTAMLGADGLPRAEIFTDDGLHMNRKGYKLWIPLIRPALVSVEG